MKPLIYLFLLISVCGYGQNIATYDFTGASGEQLSTAPAVGSVAPGWAASSITRGGMITSDAAGNSMSSKNWTFSTSFDGSGFFEFTITTPNSGTSYKISSFNFNLQRSPTGPSSYDIRYSINGASETSVANGTIATSPGSNIAFPSVSSLTTNSTVRVRIYAHGATNIGGTLRLQGSTSILPVTYLYFNTKVVKDKVALEFATASEEKNDFFQIEKSREGINFEAFDRLPSNASRGGETIYKLVDNAPYTGINYYRIKQVDTDGKFSYSKISAVDVNAKINFIVLNNRTHDAIEINSSKEAYDVQLYNTSGQLMKNLKGLSSNQTISLSDVSAGTYILRMIAGNEVVTERVVKM